MRPNDLNAPGQDTWVALPSESLTRLSLVQAARKCVRFWQIGFQRQLLDDSGRRFVPHIDCGLETGEDVQGSWPPDPRMKSDLHPVLNRGGWGVKNPVDSLR